MPFDLEYVCINILYILPVSKLLKVDQLNIEKTIYTALLN